METGPLASLTLPTAVALSLWISTLWQTSVSKNICIVVHNSRIHNLYVSLGRQKDYWRFKNTQEYIAKPCLKRNIKIGHVPGQ